MEFLLSIVLLIILFIISIPLALLFIHSRNQIESIKEFPDISEGGSLVKYGLEKDLTTGASRGQKRPTITP